ncbi:MAG: riboflavin synthase [Sedimentisphaerales bacterium]|nr:riboflavin synthase [Sedimentisphaerales bacterium]
MFTGLIEKICSVKSIRCSNDSMSLSVNLGDIARECRIGDSIAINGVCLTVSKINGEFAEFDVSGETLSKTSLKKLKISSKVNIERAMSPESRFGGHFVLGHVDGTAKIEKIEKKGKFSDIKFSADSELIDSMVEKGSVAIDGISLTICDLDKNSFHIAVIPQTLNNTTLGIAKTGELVNIETDIIIKAVKKQLENILPQKGNLTAEKLRELGF